MPKTVSPYACGAVVLASVLYKLIIRLAQFLMLRLRSDIDKEVEILVLRHQLKPLHHAFAGAHLEQGGSVQRLMATPPCT